MTALNDLDGFHLAVVKNNPFKRSYYCANWCRQPWWIPYVSESGRWVRVDRGPNRITPTLYRDLDAARRALDDVSDAPFADRIRVIDAKTGESVNLDEQAVAS